MDHRADIPALSPWRSAAFIAASVATVELLILLIVGIWLFGKFFHDEVSKATNPTTVAQVAKPMLKRGDTSVLVLNGNGIGGAASDTAEQIRGKHYLIAGTDNASRTDYPRSIIMYRPGFKREAQRLGKDFNVRRVGPLDGVRIRDLQGAHVVLVIGG